MTLAKTGIPRTQAINPAFVPDRRTPIDPSQPYGGSQPEYAQRLAGLTSAMNTLRRPTGSRTNLSGQVTGAGGEKAYNPPLHSQVQNQPEYAQRLAEIVASRNIRPGQLFTQRHTPDENPLLSRYMELFQGRMGRQRSGVLQALMMLLGGTR
jgi:hypothetical protein